LKVGDSVLEWPGIAFQGSLGDDFHVGKVVST
jgi:hypothetical protein